MKKNNYLVLVGFLFVLNICQISFEESQQLNPVEIILEGGDGSSKVRALIIKYTGNYDQSINQEIQWLDGQFGVQESNWRLTDKHRVKYTSGRIHDILTIKVLASGQEKVYYFDITDPFIKLAQKITNG
jgi:hypothetical protein